jgi:diguanylate cyclase (GGDEF)-like protein/PAS domain S-box-containing protein
MVMGEPMICGVNSKPAEVEQELLKATLEAMPAFVAIGTIQGEIFYINKTGRAMIGLSPQEELKDLTFADIHSPEILFQIQSEALPEAAKKGFWNGETTLLTRSGDEIPVSQVIVSHKDPSGNLTYFSSIARDISERNWFDEQIKMQIGLLQEYSLEMQTQQAKLIQANTNLEEANARLKALATTDGLTGLYNHRSFQERLAAEFQRYSRYRAPFSVLLLDVDHFKQFNDAYGHPAGDLVLKQVAQLIRANLRSVDFVARYGGEEFIAILPETGETASLQAAEHVRQAIEEAHWEQRPITVSIGLSTASFTTGSQATLIDEADRALYVSKSLSRNCSTHSSALEDITVCT